MSEYEVKIESDGYGSRRKEERLVFDSYEKVAMFIADIKKSDETLGERTGSSLVAKFYDEHGKLCIEIQTDDGNPREKDTISVTNIDPRYNRSVPLNWEDIDEYIKNRPYYHEKEVWERMWDDHNGDRTTYAMESAWNAMFPENATAEEIRKSNLCNVRNMLGPIMENADEVLKSARYLFSYVYELKGAPCYVAGISQSNECLEAYLDKYLPVFLKRSTIWDKSNYENDLPREGDCYTIDEMAFYSKENAFSWLNEKGFSEDEVIDYTSDILEDIDR